MRFSSFLLCIAILIACNIKRQSVVMDYQTNEVNLDLPIVPNLLLSGVITSFDTDDDSFYFASYGTFKRIVFIEKSGKIIKQINLKPLSSKIKRIRGLIIENFNSIYILDGENVIHKIDSTAKIKESLKIAAHLPSKFQDYTYDFYNPKMDFKTGNRRLIVQPYLTKTGIGSEIKSLNEKGESLKATYLVRDHYQNTPFAFLLNLDTKSEISLYEDFNRNLYSKDEYVFPVLFPTYDIAEDHLVMGSKFSNHLFRINIDNGKLLDKKIVKTDVKIKNEPINLSDLDSISNSLFKMQLEDSKNWNYIKSIVFNPFNQKLYAIIRINSNKFEKSPKMSDKRILIHDIKLRQESELVIQESKLYTILWPSRKGFYLVKNLKNDTDYRPKNVKLLLYQN